MSHPVCELSIGGRQVSSVFMSRLKSVSVTDNEGVSSDTIDIALDDGSPQAVLPKKGDDIICNFGYKDRGTAFMGRFKVEVTDGECLPYSLRITGKAADFRSKMKEHKERHWDKTKVKDIVKEIAADHGLSANVADAVGDHEYPWFGQNDASDIHILENLARRHNALFSIKNGKVIFAEKGAGKTPDGQELTSITIKPSDVIIGTFKFSLPARGQFKDVKAYWQDNEKIKRIEIKEPSDNKGTATYTLGEPFANEAEAKKAAASKAKDLKRGTGSISFDVEGNPSIRAGSKILCAGIRQGIDGVDWIVKTVVHKYSKAGFISSVTAKLKV